MEQAAKLAPPDVRVEHAALRATPAILVEQAARLAMPAVTPAERHNPERYGSSNVIQPARLRAPPQPAPSFPSPCSPWFVFSVSSVFSVVCFFRALHVVSDVGQAFQPAAGFRAGLGALCPPPSLPPNRALPQWRRPPGLPHRRFAWSKPPGLPCRRSRRQSGTIPNATGVPMPSSPHDCALHLNPPPLFHLRVLRVLCTTSP